MNSNKIRLQKAILESIDSEIRNESLSETVLDSLEKLEQIYRELNVKIPKTMVYTYIAVALHCTFRCLPGNAVERILNRRISKLENLNSKLLTKYLTYMEKGIRFLQSRSSDALINWKKENETEYKENALTVTKIFVKQAMTDTELALKGGKDSEVRAESPRTTTEEGASEVDFRAESQRTMEEAAEFVQRASEKWDDIVSKEKETNTEGKDFRIRGASEVEIRVESQRTMDEAAEFVQRASDKRDDIESKEKETNTEGKDCRIGGASEVDFRVESQQTMEEAADFLQRASEKRNEEKEMNTQGKDKDVRDCRKGGAGEVEFRVESQRTMEEAADFLQRASENCNEMESKKNETGRDKDMRNCRAECKHSEVVAEKGKEVQGEMLIHKPSAQRRQYKKPARIVYNDDLDAEIVSGDMDISVNEASIKAIVIHTPVNNMELKQSASINSPLDNSKNSPLIDESVKISLDSPKKRKAVSPLKIQEIVIHSPVNNMELKQSASINSPLDNSKNSPLIDESVKAVSPLKVYEDTKFTKRRPNKMWSPEEEDALREGIKKYGVGNWKLILNSNREVFSRRIEVDLKDKWRNLLRSASQW